MRNKQSIDQSVKEIFTQYVEQFGGEGFADNDIPQIMKRTISRKKVEFLDKSIDALNLTKEELENWEKELSQEASDKAEKTFHDFLEMKNLEMAEYQINNYRKVWSLEKRKDMAKLINPDFTISPHSDLVATLDQVKAEDRAIAKAEEKRLRKEAKKVS